MSHTEILSPLSAVPLYSQLKTVLRERILNGSYAPQSQMPSESEMVSRFKVSRITVRQALNDLQKEGLIFKIHGKGTYVAKPKAFQNVTRLQGFAEAMSQAGYEVVNQLHSFKFIPASQVVAQQLQILPGEQVAEIKRVRLLNREPVSVEITYVPAELGRQLQKADLITRDIFLILENDCGLVLRHAEITVDAVLADAILARELKVEEGAPIMRIERLTYGVNGTPLDFEYLYYRGDTFQYRMRIDRQNVTTATGYSL